MKGSRLLVGGVVLLALAVFVALFHDRIHFDFHSFLAQVRHVSLWHVAAGIALIYFCFGLRSMRWALFLQPQKKVAAASLLGSQFLGFTALALFGRLADLTRPYLIAKKTGLSVSSQVAVYTVERMFDLGAAALIFSTALVFMPKTPPMPHAEVIARLGRGSLLATLALAIFAVLLRATGGAVARYAQTIFGMVSKEFGASIAEKILGFRDGLGVLSGVKDFAAAAGLSLGMWLLIALAYVQCVHAFVQTPQLAQMSFAQTMLLMASSIAGSVVQLPVVGWFTQIGVLGLAMMQLFGVPVETATACGALLFFVTTLSIIPAGLIFAQVESISLKEASSASKQVTGAA